MGNSQSKKTQGKKGNIYAEARLSANHPDSTAGTLSPFNSIASSQSTQPLENDTKSKKSQSKVRRVSSIFEPSLNSESDSRRKPKRMLPLLPKKTKDAQEEREDVSSCNDASSSADNVIKEKTGVSPLSINDTGDDLIQRAIQAAAEATGSVGYDDPWPGSSSRPGPSSLPVNKPKSHQPIVTLSLPSDQPAGSTSSIPQQLYQMAEQAGERKKEVDRHTRQLTWAAEQVFGAIDLTKQRNRLLTWKKPQLYNFNRLQGVWCVEMAQKYPLAHVRGWALDPPTVSVPESLKNLSFVRKDLFQPAAGLTAIADSSIDFIYIRDMAYAITSNEQWISVIHEAYRVLCPGGWIEITEPDFTSIIPGPHFKDLVQLHTSVIEKAGMDPQYTHHLMSYFENEKFVECKEDCSTIPIGEWPLDSSKLLQKKDQITRRFQAMKRWYITLGGISEEKFDNLWQACLEENENGTMIQWKVFYAQKPLA